MKLRHGLVQFARHLGDGLDPARRFGNQCAAPPHGTQGGPPAAASGPHAPATCRDGPQSPAHKSVSRIGLLRTSFILSHVQIAITGLARQLAEEVLPTLPGVQGGASPELFPDIGREVLPLLGSRCSRHQWVHASFRGEGGVPSTAT